MTDTDTDERAAFLATVQALSPEARAWLAAVVEQLAAACKAGPDLPADPATGRPPVYLLRVAGSPPWLLGTWPDTNALAAVVRPGHESEDLAAALLQARRLEQEAAAPPA